MAEYVNNKLFFDEYCIWKNECRQADLEGKPHPVMTRYIGECIMKICNNLSYKGNFSGYSYRDEMVEDGIEACVKAILKFDELKYKMIFAYFTQIAFNAFVKRIKIEKREQQKKIALIKDMIYEGISRQEFDTEDYQTQMRDLIISTIDSNSMDDRMRELAMGEMREQAEEIVEETMDIYGKEE